MIYKIKNPYGAAYYVFTEQGTQVPVGVNAVFGTVEMAEQKLRELRESFLMREDYRFPIAHVVTNGNDTTWAAVDPLAIDAEGDYRVFNHNIGQYEAVKSRTECLSRRDELKHQFADEMGLFDLEVVDSFVAAFAPTVSGVQDL